MAGNQGLEAPAAHRAIMAAVDDGRVGPRSALDWARRAARGEDISLLGRMAAGAGRPDQQVRAHSNQAVLDILTQALLGDTTTDEGHVQYDNSGDIEHGDSIAGSVLAPNGQPDATRPDTISNARADLLFPQWGHAAAAQAAARGEAAARTASAASWAPYTDEELHRALFGDTSNRTAGA